MQIDTQLVKKKNLDYRKMYFQSTVNALEERIHGRKRGKLTSRPVKKEKPWTELGALCVMLLWCFVLAREHTEHGFPS